MGRTLCAVIVAVACAAFLIAGASPVVAFESPNNPSSGELVETPKEFDGTRITFEGEAIGEAMVRGEYAWMHLNDDAYMYKNVEEGAELGGFNSGMPVWLPAELARRTTIFGDYRHEGDVVRVVGTFNAACAQHGGDMDIHATELEVLTPGRTVNDPTPKWKLALALAMTVAAAVAYVADRRRGRRELLGLARSRR